MICIHTFVPQGNKDVKSPKSPLADIPTGGTRNIKSMWEKGNIGSSSESPAPANKVRER